MNTSSLMMLSGSRIKSRESSASGKDHGNLNLWLKRGGGNAISVSANLHQSARWLLPDHVLTITKNDLLSWIEIVTPFASISQQCFSLTSNQQPANSQVCFSLTKNHHQPQPTEQSEWFLLQDKDRMLFLQDKDRMLLLQDTTGKETARVAYFRGIFRRRNIWLT